MAYYGFIAAARRLSRARAPRPQRALELDPDLADAHVTLAHRTAVLGLGLGGAPSASSSKRDRAEPEAGARHIRCTRCCCRSGGRFDEAIAEARTAQRARSARRSFVNMGVALGPTTSPGRHEEAIRETLRTRELAPGVRGGRQPPDQRCTKSSDASRRPRRHHASIAAAACRSTARRCSMAVLRRAAASGLLAEAAGSLQHERDRRPRRMSIHLATRIARVHLGEDDAALDHLERMVDAHVGGTRVPRRRPAVSRTLRGAPALRGDPQARGCARATASAPHTVST